MLILRHGAGARGDSQKERVATWLLTTELVAWTMRVAGLEIETGCCCEA